MKLALAIVLALAAGLGASGQAAGSGESQVWAPGVTVARDAPMSWSGDAMIATRGSKVYVVDRYPNRIAILDLRSGTWTRTPKPPLRDTEIRGAQWAGNELVVHGVRCSDRPDPEHACSFGPIAVVVYNPSNRSWRRLPEPTDLDGDVDKLGLPLVARRNEAVFLTQTASGSVAVAIDPQTHRWRVSNGAVIGSNPPATVCTGPDFAVGVPPYDTAGAISDLQFIKSPFKRWTVVDAPTLPFRAGFVACNRNSVVIAPTATSGIPSTIQRYDRTTRAWSTVTLPPQLVGVPLIASGHGPYIDFFDTSAGLRPIGRPVGSDGSRELFIQGLPPDSRLPGMRLATSTGQWSPIEPGPPFEMQLGPDDLHWSGDLAVRGPLVGDAQLLVYRP